MLLLLISSCTRRLQQVDFHCRHDADAMGDCAFMHTGSWSHCCLYNSCCCCTACSSTFFSPELGGHPPSCKPLHSLVSTSLGSCHQTSRSTCPAQTHAHRILFKTPPVLCSCHDVAQCWWSLGLACYYVRLCCLDTLAHVMRLAWQWPSCCTPHPTHMCTCSAYEAQSTPTLNCVAMY